jgi:hypothetical protein
MSDLGTQLRSYFDENVERVTPDDVLAGRHVGDLMPEPRFKWRASPRLAVGLGFAVTVFVIGGSLGLGLVLRQPGDISGSGRMALGIGDGTPESTGWGLVGIAAALAAIALVFIVLAMRSTRTGSRRNGEEKKMSTTFETQEVDHKLEDAHRANRWLIAAVVVLSVALIALGAWVISDLTAASENAVPDDIAEMLDDYTAAWNAGDGEAFTSYIRETDYEHTANGVSITAEVAAGNIESYWGPDGIHVEQIGESVVLGDGITRYVVQPNRVVTVANPDGFVGFSVFTVTDWSDNGWVVIDHTFIGDWIR